MAFSCGFVQWFARSRDHCRAFRALSYCSRLVVVQVIVEKGAVLSALELSCPILGLRSFEDFGSATAERERLRTAGPVTAGKCIIVFECNVF